jgi:Flp pilus assembly pilin Flp
MLPRRLRRFLADESGATLLETVLYVGVISLPLVTFLAIFGQDVIQWIREVAPQIFDEGATFLG